MKTIADTQNGVGVTILKLSSFKQSTCMPLFDDNATRLSCQLGKRNCGARVLSQASLLKIQPSSKDCFLHSLLL